MSCYCHISNNDGRDKEWGNLWLRDLWQGNETGWSEQNGIKREREWWLIWRSYGKEEWFRTGKPGTASLAREWEGSLWRRRGEKKNLLCKNQQILHFDENKPSKKHNLECDPRVDWAGLALRQRRFQSVQLITKGSARDHTLISISPRLWSLQIRNLTSPVLF